MSIPMSFTKDTVGNEELTFVKLIVGGLKVEEVMNLFAIFPIGATMQDGGKRKRSDDNKNFIYQSLLKNSKIIKIDIHCLM